MSDSENAPPQPDSSELADEELSNVAGGEYTGSHVLYQDVFVPANNKSPAEISSPQETTRKG